MQSLAKINCFKGNIRQYIRSLMLFLVDLLIFLLERVIILGKNAKGILGFKNFSNLLLIYFYYRLSK